MKAEIITIGDELLIGQVVNTNQAYIAEQVNGAGIGIVRMTTVGDDPVAIENVFRQGWTSADVVIVTGGLGPTHDDVTKKVFCSFFKTTLASDPDVRHHIEGLLAKRNLPWTAAIEEQTLVPVNCRVLHNPLGTAPGLLHEEHGRMFVVLPGVPHEMKAIVDTALLPMLRARAGTSVVRHRTLCTTGISESMIAARLGDLGDLLDGASLAFLPSPLGVRMRISIEAPDSAAADAVIARAERRIRDKVQKYIYGVDDEQLEAVVGRLLTERSMTIAVAESCTGGLIADRLTNVSGSSAYVERGLVAYSNRSKIMLLGVREELIERHGAVSREVAEAMAAGVLRTAGTDIGISTTGIAGPTGGTPEKPVGMVWIGYADSRDVFAVKFMFGDVRLLVKQRASQAALELVRRRIMNIGE